MRLDQRGVRVKPAGVLGGITARMPKMKTPTAAEDEVLALVLREMRSAVAMKQQLQITIDPWSAGGGVNIFFGLCAVGWSTEVWGQFIAKKAPRGKTK